MQRLSEGVWPWHEWLGHTNFSFLAGASHPSDFVDAAMEYGYRSLAVTDYDGVYGVVRAHRRMAEWEKEGLKSELQLLVGAECHLAKDHEQPLLYQDTLAFLAPTAQAYQQLCHIISGSFTAGKHHPHIHLDDLAKKPCSELIALQPMRGIIRTLDDEVLRTRLRYYQAIFHDRFYLVLTLTMTTAEDIWAQRTLQLAEEMKLPILMSQDPFFHHPEQKDVSDVLHAMRCNQSIENIGPQLFPNGERSLHPCAELVARYQKLSHWKRYCQNAEKLLQRFTFNLTELKYQYPKEKIPSGHTAQSYLESRVWEAVEMKYKRSQYPEGIPEKYLKIILHELQMIREKKIVDYFLTVVDIMTWAREQNILCQGRGSAANSLVCYVLGITSVDPDNIEALFERFISQHREDPPDIDVDFEHERREEVIQHIYETYGRKRAAMVANVITMHGRGAMRYVGKALGIPDDIIGQVNGEGWPDDPDFQVLHETYPHLRWEAWAHLSRRISGFPRHMGIHSGGFMITERELEAVVPQEPATMPGRTVIQWSKEDIEYLRMFKIDILALGMLSAIRKMFSYLKEHKNIDLTLATIPQDDRPTYQMIQRADTVGTFQIESRAQMSMLPRLRPQHYYDLVVQVAIVRPGPIQGGLIQPYLARRERPETVQYPHEDLKPILQRTLGVPIFQEQIMRIAMVCGGFEAGEADELRRQIGAWKIKAGLEPLVKKLTDGLRKKGIEDIYVQQIVGHLRGFAEYGFPESHAASFALLAYASSYLKKHHPDAFFAALLNSQPMGFYSSHALIQAAQRDGVEVRPICVLQSSWNTTLETTENPRRFALRLGFDRVRGACKENIESMVKRRDRVGTWDSLWDFLQDSKLGRRDLTALAASHAFAAYGLERRSALWIAEAAGYASLFEEDLEESFATEDPLQASERDFQAFGTTLGEHPVAMVRQHYWSYPVNSQHLQLAKAIEYLPHRLQVTVFGLIQVRQMPESAKGMVFFTVEDETGLFNLVFAPQVYEKWRLVINRQGFICVEGTLQRFAESHSIMVQKVYQPDHGSEVIPLTKEALQQFRRQKPVSSAPEQKLHKPLQAMRFARARNFH